MAASTVLLRLLAGSMLLCLVAPALAEDRPATSEAVSRYAADGRIAVVVAEGVDAAAFRAALQEQLEFPVVSLADPRATATSRRLLVVARGKRVVLSLQDFGSDTVTETLTLPRPVTAADRHMPEALQAAAVPLLRRASSPLFRRTELINPFDSQTSAFTHGEAMLDPFSQGAVSAVSSDLLDFGPIAPGSHSEVLDPFGMAPSQIPPRANPSQEGAHALGRPRASSHRTR